MGNSEANTVAVTNIANQTGSQPGKARGYFGIGIYNHRHDVNVGALLRSAFCFGASFVYTVGRRYQKQASDTPGTPQQVPLYHYEDLEHLKSNVPTGCRLIGVELDPTAKDLTRYCHPAQAMYLLGHESSGLPSKVLAACNDVVMIAGLRTCLNVATAGSVVLFDRLSKGVYSGK